MWEGLEYESIQDFSKSQDLVSILHFMLPGISYLLINNYLPMLGLYDGFYKK